MWDLIVSVPDHCLSFYYGYFRFTSAKPKIDAKHHCLLKWCAYVLRQVKDGNFIFPETYCGILRASIQENDAFR